MNPTWKRGGLVIEGATEGRYPASLPIWPNDAIVDLVRLTVLHSSRPPRLESIDVDDVFGRFTEGFETANLMEASTLLALLS